MFELALRVLTSETTLMPLLVVGHAIATSLWCVCLRNLRLSLLVCTFAFTLGSCAVGPAIASDTELASLGGIGIGAFAFARLTTGGLVKISAISGLWVILVFLSALQR